MITHRNVVAAVSRHRALVRVQRARCVDAVPLLRVRFFGLGDLGRAALRRPPRGRAVPGQPLARGVLRTARHGTGHGAEPDAVGVPPADSGRRGGRARRTWLCAMSSSAAKRSKCRACGRGSIGTATRQPRLVNMYGITETTVHVTYRPLSKDDVRSGSVIGVPIPDLQIYILDPQRPAGARRRAGRNVRRRRRPGARLSQSPRADGGAVRSRRVTDHPGARGSIARATWRASCRDATSSIWAGSIIR